MYITLLKNQRVTFVSSIEEAYYYSPYKMRYNEKSNRYVVEMEQQIVAAGLSKEEAEACVMYRANQYIYNNVQKGY
jgi:hypothetical protein